MKQQSNDILPIIERIQVLNIQSGDLIVFRLKDDAPDELFFLIKKQADEFLARWFPENRIIVTRDIDISVIQKDEDK